MVEEKQKMKNHWPSLLMRQVGEKVGYIDYEWLFEVHSIRLEYIWQLIYLMCKRSEFKSYMALFQITCELPHHKK
jgi:hypothetical protein